MKQYLKHDEWCVIEEGFHEEHNEITESIMSLGNGRMGQRGNFEEYYSGKTFPGNYIAGVYYPDKTRVGWWKNGYPEYFAKVLNAVNWMGINAYVDGDPLDLAKCTISSFRRVLNMKEGYLERTVEAAFPDGRQFRLHTKRFLSIVEDEAGAVRFGFTPLNFSGTLTLTPYLDFDVSNRDSNYGEKFWEEVFLEASIRSGSVVARTKKLDFFVCASMRYDLFQEGVRLPINEAIVGKREKFVSSKFDTPLVQGKETVLYKYAAVLSSENHPSEKLLAHAHEVVTRVHEKGFDALLQEHIAAWAHKWDESDILIEGDVAAQQGIRFNIFQLNQTYTGQDPRLNIGPKGFTGEKYGGSTYWDTEAYCIPFYLSTSEPQVARNLLVYRYKHLPKAIENAQKLGFTGGAALYPMVTMNGEECHNEWEITFEEIHRNGAIAYAISNYIRYTDDKAYLAEYGLEVLIGIARFWAQRVNWSSARQKYVMLGVTGPNEYENNINNNWYTNYLAVWCMDYAMGALAFVQREYPEDYARIVAATSLDQEKETGQWNHICAHMYFPYDENLGIFLQQDGYLDKEQVLVKDLDPKDRPLNQKWSWDRILRSCFIKQADVLQGIYFFEEHFEEEVIRRNFDFYEPRTVHESSLSPCVHAILAAKLGDEERAYQFYLRTARLDLDDYNNDTEDGCHITSMAGTWMAVVQGFGGMRVENGRLSFRPFIPKQWSSYSFKVVFRDSLLNIKVTREQVHISNEGKAAATVMLYDQGHQIEPGQQIASAH